MKSSIAFSINNLSKTKQFRSLTGTSRATCV